MSSLVTAFEYTRSALAQNGERSSLISRNVAGASNANYSRKTMQIVTDQNGLPTPGVITRVVDRLLLATSLESSSVAAAADATRSALDQLDPAAATPNGAGSMPTLVTDLQNALQTASATPSSPVSLQGVVSAANTLASGLRSASAQVDAQRNQADLGIGAAVKNVNGLLAKYATADKAVQTARVAGADATDLEDARDGIAKDIAQQIGVQMVTQPDGSTALYTDGGATLYDRCVRSVTFSGSGNLGPGAMGAAVFVDGVPVTGNGPMASKSGAIAGLADVRDHLAPVYQSQLDGIARGLIEAFSETDPSGSQPPAAGLFTWSGGSGVPPQPTPTGLAGSIGIAANADASKGGDPTLVRDGGIAGAAYGLNPSGSAGFTDRLQALVSALDAPRGFDPSTEAATGNQSVVDFTASSSSWLAAARKTATDTATYQDSISTQATTALSNATGVNIDDEMARMLEVEHSYQTSARLLTTIDQMYSALLQSVPGAG